MIVIGTDTHKESHTAAALDEGTARVLADRTVRARRRSFDDLLLWGRGLDAERVWALEDCRHVSGALERFLLARGERVVRVAPKLTGGSRDSARERGKSDAIDAVAIACAAIREGLDTLPVAQLAGLELDIRLLVDRRDRLVATRTRLINDLRGRPRARRVKAPEARATFFEKELARNRGARLPVAYSSRCSAMLTTNIARGAHAAGAPPRRAPPPAPRGHRAAIRDDV